jgi:preprotein translocase subunit SecB
MNADNNVSKIKEHPNQLIHVGVKELSILSNIPPNVRVKYEDNSAEIITTHTKFKKSSNEIHVSIKLRFGNDNPDEYPFKITVEIIGIFRINTKLFEEKFVELFAKNNAPVILYPYLREQVYSLTTKSGFPPLLLPLIEVPSIISK